MPNQQSHSRRHAFARQRGLCHYCRLPMWLDDHHVFLARYPLTRRQALLRRCTAEHLQPRQDGGGAGRANIVAACAFCNHTRHRAHPPLDPKRYACRVRARLAQGGWLPAEVYRVLVGVVPGPLRQNPEASIGC